MLPSGVGWDDSCIIFMCMSVSLSEIPHAYMHSVVKQFKVRNVIITLARHSAIYPDVTYIYVKWHVHAVHVHAVHVHAVHVHAVHVHAVHVHVHAVHVHAVHVHAVHVHAVHVHVCMLYSINFNRHLYDLMATTMWFDNTKWAPVYCFVTFLRHYVVFRVHWMFASESH